MICEIDSISSSIFRYLDEPEELIDSSDFRPRIGTNESSSSRISKQDISFPTKTSGPLFVPEQDESFPGEGLSPYEQRRKISLLPCPDEDFSEQAKHAKHRRYKKQHSCPYFQIIIFIGENPTHYS